MFEKNHRLRVRSLLETQFNRFRQIEKAVKGRWLDSSTEKAAGKRSTNERNMTRKTRSGQLRIHSAFQSGYCAICHIPYPSLEDHIQSKRHRKLTAEDGSFISLKGFDSFLALDGIDADEVNGKNCHKMPRTRVKESPMSPVGSDSGGHHLRSRKNINYMTPPLEEDTDSLTEKPDDVKEFRELRSSSRLLAKFADQMVESDEVWNSGRPKRSCNRQRPSTDERLIPDKIIKQEIVSTKLRSGGALLPPEPAHRRPRNAELERLNNEAENFLFPKKDDSSDDEDAKLDSAEDGCKKVKMEDDESMHSTCSESKGKKKRRTHAEAFINDNQKYYKFEMPGSRLRYHGSYLSPVPMKAKNNGDCTVKREEYDEEEEEEEEERIEGIHFNDYNFSFESVPKREVWYQTFQRHDTGEEKYTYISDDNYWNPLILPYQLAYIPPLNPQDCLAQYNQIKKCLLEPSSSGTSVTCSTPDPTASNSSTDPHFCQDDDSKISTTDACSPSSTDEAAGSARSKTRRTPAVPGNGKNPRKSPRQHASTLAILSSLIHQRKRKPKPPLSPIVEEARPPKPPRKPKIDYASLARSVEEEFAAMCEEDLSELEISKDETITFKGKMAIDELINPNEAKPVRKPSAAKPGRKPGKRKKNRTGWPLNRARRARREPKEEEADSESVNADSENEEAKVEVEATDSIKRAEMSENNNKNDQSSLDVDSSMMHCDGAKEDRVDGKSGDSPSQVLTPKVNNSDDLNVDLQYQPFVRVQKLDKIGCRAEAAERGNSPKRTNRGQRRMPASPKSPRMLRRPRGRWYRER